MNRLSAILPFVPAPTDIAAELAAHGLGEFEQSALRALWHSADIAALRGRLSVALAPWADDASMRAGHAPVANFFSACLDVVGWELDQAWPERMRSQWLALQLGTVPVGLAARVASAIVATLQADLAAQRASLSALDASLIQIVSRIGFFLVGWLDGAASVTEAQARLLAEYVEPGSGLPNRAALEQIFLPAEADEPSSAMLAVALMWGGSAIVLNSAERDLARIEIGRALGKRARPGDSLCRVGDDEWVLWAPGIGAGVRPQLAAAALLESGEQALRNVGLAAHATLAVGGALTPEDGSTADGVFNAARRARAAALREGRTIRIAGPELEMERAERVQTEREFIEALRNNAFELHLQPVIQLSDGECPGAEALLRWQRADGTAVPPLTVVAMAEQFGLMQQLTRLVIQRATAMLSELGEQGVPIGIAVNLAGGDLRDPELPEFIAQALATWHIAPSRLALELTEGSMIADDAQTMSVIARLRDAGHGVALDDFGTGYSSLAWLRRLPATRLKIDRMFVHKMPETAQDRAIVRSVVQLAQGLGLSVIAEGVEREEHVHMLRAMGCDAAQGFHIARPMPLDAFIAWWRRWNSETQAAWPPVTG
ncbi:putative bifunctional diguanylate cyclase/phosphodiesterase [Niveibacterium sp.]|uniref:putative bifunctional diguanylate cyclase/phosphodiesterase n=1 Tax=Niveibacterium sp. TaxID=2017444 RepID=UPI0035B0C7EE